MELIGSQIHSERDVMKFWMKAVLMTMVIVLGIFWVLIISDISQWWHWEQWMEHIRVNHL